jgi:flagellar protein FliO/FliZ
MSGFLLLTPVARAAESVVQKTPAATGSIREAAKQSAAHDPMAMSSLWQLTLGMLVVLGLIVVIAWLLKRSGRFQVAAGGGLRILGGLSMGARERVVLMQVGETQLLLGVAPGRVQTLHVLEQPLAAGQSANRVTGGFADQLGRMLKKDKLS